MSQNDLSIANQGFASFRSDLNSALQALGSTNSGTSAPSTTYANQLFYDTTNNILKFLVKYPIILNTFKSKHVSIKKASILWSDRAIKEHEE